MGHRWTVPGWAVSLILHSTLTLVQRHPQRLTPSDGHQTRLKLARLLDKDLASWLNGNFARTDIPAARPAP